MIRIVADNFVKPESKDTFLELAAELVKGTRTEEGNISYHLCRDRSDDCHFTFIEEWKDAEAIELHNHSEHFTTIVPKLGECASKPGTCYLYDEEL